MPTIALIHTVDGWRRVADRLDAAGYTVLARQIRRALARKGRCGVLMPAEDCPPGMTGGTQKGDPSERTR